MTLYHASNVEVRTPRIIRSTRMLDFGFGFYTTTNLEQAKRFAHRVFERTRSGRALVNVYELDEARAFAECSLLRFDSPDEKWLDFVAANRTGIYGGETYDLVYGPVANDDVYKTINAYIGGFAERDWTLKQLMVRKLYNQLVFATEKSLGYLRHIITEVL